MRVWYVRYLLFISLFFASLYGSTSVVDQNFEKFLTDISNGNIANVKSTLTNNSSYINKYGQYGKTPLMTAVGTTAPGASSTNVNSIITYILGFSGVDVNIKDNLPLSGRTALICALESKNFDRVKLLVDAGADVNILSNEKRSPFIYALLSGNIDIVRLLCSKSINDIDPTKSIKDEKGYSCFYYAYQINSVDIFNYLILTKYPSSYDITVLLSDIERIPLWWFEKNQLYYGRTISSTGSVVTEGTLFSNIILNNLAKISIFNANGVKIASSNSAYESLLSNYINAQDTSIAGKNRTALMYALGNKNKKDIVLPYFTQYYNRSSYSSSIVNADPHSQSLVTITDSDGNPALCYAIIANDATYFSDILNAAKPYQVYYPYISYVYTAGQMLTLAKYACKVNALNVWVKIVQDCKLYTGKYYKESADDFKDKLLNYFIRLNDYRGLINNKNQSALYSFVDYFSKTDDFFSYVVGTSYTSASWIALSAEVSTVASPNTVIGLIMKKYPTNYAYMNLFVNSLTVYLSYDDNGTILLPYLLEHMKNNNFTQATGTELSAGQTLLANIVSLMLENYSGSTLYSYLLTIQNNIFEKAIAKFTTKYPYSLANRSSTALQAIDTFFAASMYHDIMNNKLAIYYFNRALDLFSTYFADPSIPVDILSLAQKKYKIFMTNQDVNGDTVLLHALKDFASKNGAVASLSTYLQNWFSTVLQDYMYPDVGNALTGKTPLMYIIEQHLLSKNLDSSIYSKILNASDFSVADASGKTALDYAMLQTNNFQYLYDLIRSSKFTMPANSISNGFLQTIIANTMFNVTDFTTVLSSLGSLRDSALTSHIYPDSGYSFSKAEAGNTPLITAIQVAQQNMSKKYYFDALKNISMAQWKEANPGNKRHPFAYLIRSSKDLFRDSEIITLMQSYLDEGDINFTDNDNDSLLMHACDMERWDVALYLLSLPGIDATILNNKNQKDALTYVAQRTSSDGEIPHGAVADIIKKLMSVHFVRNMQSYKGFNFVGRLLQKLGANSTASSENYSFADFMSFVFMTVRTKDDVTVFQEPYLGRLPLDWATVYMFPELLEAVKTYPDLLLASNNPADMLYFAVKFDSLPNFIKAMRSFGVNDHITGGNHGLDGYTPLQYVAEKNRFEMVDYLILIGASVTFENNKALWNALKSHAMRVAYLLRFCGAKVSLGNSSQDEWMNQFESEMKFADNTISTLSIDQIYRMICVKLNRIDLVPDFEGILYTYIINSLITANFGKSKYFNHAYYHNRSMLDTVVNIYNSQDKQTRNLLEYTEVLIDLVSGQINSTYSDVSNYLQTLFNRIMSMILTPLDMQNKYYYVARYSKKLADDIWQRFVTFHSSYNLYYTLEISPIPNPNYTYNSPFAYFTSLAAHFGLSYSWINARSAYSNQDLYYELWQQSPAHAKAFANYAKYVVPIPEPYVGDASIGDYAGILAAYLEKDNTFIDAFVLKSTQEQYDFFKSVNRYYALAFAKFLQILQITIVL